MLAQTNFEPGELRDQFCVSGRKLIEGSHGKRRGCDPFQARSPNDRSVREPQRGVLGFLRQKRRWKDNIFFFRNPRKSLTDPYLTHELKKQTH